MHQSVGIRFALWGALVVLALAAAQTETSRAADTSAVDRGRYLMAIGICESCHTPKDAEGKSDKERYLAGGHRVGGLLSSNLTSDSETGLGSWTDEQIIASIRNGVRPDGGPVRPPMGTYFYRNLSDADVKAIVAFLRTAPAIKNPVERLAARGPAPKFEPVQNVLDPDRGDMLVYGRYLAETIGHCFQCHTPRINGQPDQARLGAGGNTYTARGGGTIMAPNITPTRLGSWSDDQIKSAITKGVRADGGQMASVMDYDLYARMTESDLSAMIAYLRKIPPISDP
jgi:mono/diheme cytochrome c family protein